MTDGYAEFCQRCGRVTPSRVIDHATATEWKCAICGWQVDLMVNEEDDDSEPTDSCESCGANIYPHEDDGSHVCDQCQWYAEHGASNSNEVIP